MRQLHCFAAILVCLLWAFPLSGQKQKREPLTEAQIEQIRDAGNDPPDRVRLYTKFLDEHADLIKRLSEFSKSAERGKRLDSVSRSRRLDDELQDFTTLMDELGNNLDLYSDRHSDIRHSLKLLSDAAPRWISILHALAGEPGFDLARKEAIESCEELADQASRLLREQTDYFNTHKDERGQEREMPK